MHRAFAAILVIAFVAPAAHAQHRFDLSVDLEGVRRSNHVQFEPNTVRYQPDFDSGGGIGVAANIFLSSRFSLELKAAGLGTKFTVRRTGGDFIAVADAGTAQLYPITALLQWHFQEKGAFRPYLGAGAGYVLLRNIDKRVIGATAVRFKDPTGLVVDGGLEIPISKRWSAFGDARYTPIETQAEAEFIGVTDVRINVRPLVVSFGLAYHF